MESPTNDAVVIGSMLDCGRQATDGPTPAPDSDHRDHHSDNTVAVVGVGISRSKLTALGNAITKEMDFFLERSLGSHGRDGFPSWEEITKSRERWISFLEGDKTITGEMDFLLGRTLGYHWRDGFPSWKEIRLSRERWVSFLEGD